MAQHLFWILFLGCLAVVYAAPTIAPTNTPNDQDLAEVKKNKNMKTEYPHPDSKYHTQT